MTSDAPERRLEFPDGFMWGSGISAHQTEGDNRHSDWWPFEASGAIAHGEVSGRATDHWHRYREDFGLARDLNQRLVKISVEWARIEPEPGLFDEDALGHYHDVLESMRSLGLTPLVVLHHFTSPQWLAGFGNWEGRQTPERFAAFVRVVASRLGAHCQTWITVNEPMLLAAMGYLHGTWPPQRRGWRSARRAWHNLIRAHGLARYELRSLNPFCRVGVAVNTTALRLSGHPTLWERSMYGVVDWLANHYYVDRVRSELDFVGLQYYSHNTVRQLIHQEFDAWPEGAAEKTDMGWDIYPRGIYTTVANAYKRWKIPIIITENGIADATDRHREAFTRDHLAWLHRAIREGADVRGYLHWALTDNFEWLEGFDPRFGLVGIDYDTLERHIRPSAHAYARICAENAVVIPGDHPSLVL